MRAAVLGCGPAGLIAAHVLALHDYEPVIISAKVEKSPLPGVLYLHEPIPGVTPPEPAGRLRFGKVGSKEGYAAKVYGSKEAPCSWDDFPVGFVDAWDAGATYNTLWDKFSDCIGQARVIADDLDGYLASFDRVVSTIPRPMTCLKPGEHSFKSRPYWVADMPAMAVSKQSVTYNGHPGIGWYRASNVFGHATMEYPHKPRTEARQGVKVIGHDCTCHPQVLHVGRFGKWEKGVLLHHVYSDMQYYLTEELR